MSESSEALVSTAESVKPAISGDVKLNGDSTETKTEEVPVVGAETENDKPSSDNSPVADPEPTSDPAAVESNEVSKTESSPLKENASSETINKDDKKSTQAKEESSETVNESSETKSESSPAEDEQPQKMEVDSSATKDEEPQKSEEGSPTIETSESQKPDTGKSKSPISNKVESTEDEKPPTKKTSRKRKLSTDKISSEEESDEEKVGSLEADPVIQDGVKRARKKTERLSDMIGKDRAEKDDKKLIPEGKGVPLGEIEFISRMIKVSKMEDLKFLHYFIFGRQGNPASLRANLRKFRGFEFDIDSSKYTSKLASKKSKKATTADYKSAIKILGLELKGTKDDLMARLLKFLVHPQEKDVMKLPKKHTPKKRKSSGKAKSSKTKSSKRSKKKDESDEESEPEDEAEEDEDEDDKEDEEEEEEEEKEKEKETPKKTPKRGRAPKSTTKKTPKKRAAPKRKSKKESEDEISDVSDDEDEDDEPSTSAKRAKKMPTDEELKQTILKLLEDVDLEKVTMKNVLQQIYEKYDGLDLTHKKEFLKSVVKDILSN